MPQDVGFVGLGNIGRPMALNVLKRFGHLAAFDIDAARVRTLAEAGAVAAGSLAVLASKTKVILLSLPTSAEVMSSIGGQRGARFAISGGLA